MSAHYEVLGSTRSRLGEGPTWHPEAGLLYWTDIEGRRIHYLRPESGEEGVLLEAGEQVGGLTLQTDGSLLLFGENGRIRCWRDGRENVIVEGIPELQGSRFNDVIVDPAGRVLAGTMPGRDERARLYRLDLDGSLALLRDDLRLANGMGFTPDRASLYLTDTKAGSIYRHPYDAGSGTLAPGEVFARVTEGGFPDGLTVDAEGYVWSARWAGGRLVRYAPDGHLEGEHHLPVENVTSAAFAGPDLAELHVTTAGAGENELAGAVFRLRLGVRGLPEFRSRVLL